MKDIHFIVSKIEMPNDIRYVISDIYRAMLFEKRQKKLKPKVARMVRNIENRVTNLDDNVFFSIGPYSFDVQLSTRFMTVNHYHEMIYFQSEYFEENQIRLCRFFIVDTALESENFEYHFIQ
jgi:hypothetical protein